MLKYTKAQLVAAGIDPKFFDQVSQFAHFFTMFALAIVCGLAGPLVHLRLWGVFIGLGLCLIWASGHEFWYDPKYENAATRGSDLEDFCFLMMGGVSGALAALLFLYFYKIV
jgi:hypothetical protein